MTERLIQDLAETMTPNQIQEFAAQLRHLERTPVWGFLLSFLRQQYDQRTYMIISTPMDSMDKTLAQEYMKGEAASFLIMTSLVGNLAEYLETLAPQVTHDDENASTGEHE